MLCLVSLRRGLAPGKHINFQGSSGRFRLFSDLAMLAIPDSLSCRHSYQRHIRAYQIRSSRRGVWVEELVEVYISSCTDTVWFPRWQLRKALDNQLIQ